MAALQEEKERIHSLQDTRRNLVICLASDDVARNANLVSVITAKIKKINEQINELTSLLNRGERKKHQGDAIVVQFNQFNIVEDKF